MASFASFVEVQLERGFDRVEESAMVADILALLDRTNRLIRRGLSPGERAMLAEALAEFEHEVRTL